MGPYMRILLATPLYPPDIAEPAPYVKELAKRLSKEHIVTIVAYGTLPEKIQGVRIIAVNKRRPLLLRLLAYTTALVRASRDADLIYAENGASVELPAGLVALITGRPLVIHIGDKDAHERAARNKLYFFIEKFAILRAQRTIIETPMKRPEILPLEPRPDAALAAYEASWSMHFNSLNTIFAHER